MQSARNGRLFEQSCCTWPQQDDQRENSENRAERDRETRDGSHDDAERAMANLLEAVAYVCIQAGQSEDQSGGRVPLSLVRDLAPLARAAQRLLDLDANLFEVERLLHVVPRAALLRKD